MNAIKKLLTAVDRLQQRWPVLAFPVAVWRKFNDDQAGNLAALISYYGFAALFPLLLVLVTVLNMLLSNDPSLRSRLLNSALAQYPVIGPQINASLGHISGTGLPLIIGIVLLVLGARGVAGAMQNALCEVWDIPREDRPGFPLSQLLAMALMFTIGFGFIATTTLSGLAQGAGHVISGGVGAYIGAALVSLILNVGVFWLGFRIATLFKVPWRQLRTGAAIAAVCWQVLQLVGSYVVSHQLQRASELYGTFGIVLGLLAWLYLQAEVTIYAAEVDVVLARHLWPRSLLSDTAGPPPPGGPAPDDPRAPEPTGQVAKTATAPDLPASTDSPGQPARAGQEGRGKHARPEGPSSLEGQPGHGGEAAAGERSHVPSPRDKPPASERAAGQR